MDEDVYFHKTVTFRAWKHSLQFRTSQELFRHKIPPAHYRRSRLRQFPAHP
jgi:hypothetical protein